jgi:integrase
LDDLLYISGQMPAQNPSALLTATDWVINGEISSSYCLPLPPPSEVLPFRPQAATITPVTPNQRKGRKMSRRWGQRGFVEQKGNWWHVRYWADSPEGRTHASHPICLAVGKGKKTKSEAKRLAADWLTEQGINTEQHLERALGGKITFGDQAEEWLHNLRTRNREPIPESSVPSIRSALNCWLLPHLGEMPLSEVGNKALRGLVGKMKGHLSAKTMNTYVNMAKEIVESRLDEEGEPIYARKWNNDVIDLPVVKKREQRRPKLAKEGVTAVIADCGTPWERMLYILCPAGGMRIAEVLALDIDKHISSDCRVIKVRGQVKENRIVSYLKTDAAYREIDLCPEVAELLKNYIGGRHGLLFPSKTRKTPMSYSNVRRRSLHPKLVKLGLYTPGAAMHCFRRFRSAVLRKYGCPEDLRKFWLGHENSDISDEYAEQLLEDIERRQEVAARIGLGFEIPKPSFVPKVPKTPDSEVVAVAA